MAGPWRLHLVVAADKTSHLGSTMCFTQKKTKNGKAWKTWATDYRRLRALLEWKFQVQDFHELEVLSTSLIHSVARMG